jgi:hypothetical protein
MAPGIRLIMVAHAMSQFLEVEAIWFFIFWGGVLVYSRPDADHESACFESQLFSVASFHSYPPTAW